MMPPSAPGPSANADRKVAIVDLQVCNLNSIRNMLRRLGAEPVFVADAAGIDAARRLVLPGVGHFDAVMDRVESAGIRDALQRAAIDRGVPTLGICVGMQIMTRGSAEGHARGLGWFEGTCERFPALAGLRVPHMGWNTLAPNRHRALFNGLGPDARFYFVHSYQVRAAVPAEVAASAEYGVEFAAALAKGNVAGVQFHPEKSHRFGMRVLENFLTRF